MLSHVRFFSGAVSIFLLQVLAAYPAISAQVRTAVQGQPLELNFENVNNFSEMDTSPNPFTDRQLTVVFDSPTGQEIAVPGYFAGDGRAADTGATSGNIWRAHFVPDQPGRWKWSAVFRAGVGLSSEASSEGRPAEDEIKTPLRGQLEVASRDLSAPGFLSRGTTLRFVGERYLKWPSAGLSFLKAGINSPENFLAFADFDNTPPSHFYIPHARDWKEGDPTWRNGMGKNLIGALNYLSAQGINSFYALTLNVDGEGSDVWPWSSPRDVFHFDISKLAQWEIVFSHMDHLGIQMHLVTQEQKNDHLLDNGTLGPARRLYYRELVARFAHHNAVIWNLGEENDNATEEIVRFSRFIKGLDPYDHPVALHNMPLPWLEKNFYDPYLGSNELDVLSLQHSRPSRIPYDLARWSSRARDAERPWVLNVDEADAMLGGAPEDSAAQGHDRSRRDILWPALMGGAGGVEWYSGVGFARLLFDKTGIPRLLGFELADPDLDIEDFRSREQLWVMTRIAIEFFRCNLPFWEMEPSTDAGTKTSTLAHPDGLYVAHLPTGGTATIHVKPGRYFLSWFDPRGGRPLGREERLVVDEGTAELSLDSPEQRGDWIALLRAVHLKRATCKESPTSFLCFTETGSAGRLQCPGLNLNARIDLRANDLVKLR